MLQSPTIAFYINQDVIFIIFTTELNELAILPCKKLGTTDFEEVNYYSNPLLVRIYKHSA